MNYIRFILFALLLCSASICEAQTIRREFIGSSHATWTVVGASESKRTSDSVDFVMWDDDDVSIIVYTTDTTSPNLGKSAVVIRLAGIFQDTGTYVIPELRGFWRSGGGKLCPVVTDSGTVHISFIDTNLRHVRGTFRMVVDCDSTHFLIKEGSFDVCGVYLNQYDVGNEVDLPIAFGKEGGNACGPTALGQALNAFKRSNGEDTISIYDIYGKVMEENDNYEDDNGLGFSHAYGVSYLKSFGYTPVYRNKDSDGDDAAAVLSALDSLLALGYVAITGTKFGEAAYPTKGGGHVVLTLGRTEDERYIVNDPAGNYFEFPTNDPTRHYRAGSDGAATTYPVDSALALEYGRWFIAFKYEPTIDPPVLAIRVNLTVNDKNVTTPFMIRDPQGRRAGWDQNMVKTNEIPGAELMLMPTDETGPGDPNGGDTDPATYATAITIVNPAAAYEILPLAPQSGELKASAVLFDGPDKRIDTVMTKSVTTHEPVTFTYSTPRSAVRDMQYTNPPPVQLELDRNYFTEAATQGSLHFTIAARTEVVATIHNATGREQASIVRSQFGPGDHLLPFSTESLPNGVYFIRLKAGSSIGMKKIVVVK